MEQNIEWGRELTLADIEAKNNSSLCLRETRA